MNNTVSDSSSLADIRVNTAISIIIPTFREVENIPHILARLDTFRKANDLDIEVLFMDDNSQDGSVEAVNASGFEWARTIVRTSNRGLSNAVIDGFRAASFPVIVCMDCDLSHPPEKIPHMVMGLASGQQMVVGSRYVPGASTDDDWGLLRWLNSIEATLLARPLTSVRDPMSGFLVMRKSDFDQADNLTPIGYKVALELIVKCGFENVGEVPIHFSDRIHGDSKLTLNEQLKYIQHLRRLYIYKFTNAMHVLQFLVVGASGVAVNLTVLTLLLLINLPEYFALAGGIGVSVVTNFLLNRRFTFSYARDGNIFSQFIAYLGASAVGAVVNYSVALILRNYVLPDTSYALYIAAVTGVLAGVTFNFIGSRYFVFRERFFRE
jgi:dolichol-phosphate mannosyltransferase